MASRPSASIKSKLERNLTTYVAAASAAGVVVLAASMPSPAEIIYTPANDVIRARQSFNLDLDQDGTTDFIIKDAFHRTCTDKCSGTSARLFLKPAKGNGAAGVTGIPFAPAFALKAGSRINRHQYFVGSLLARIYSLFGTHASGSWINFKDRYLGLRFKINGENHFGWARLSVSVQRFSITATLTGYAYETIPHKSIRAGQTQEAADSVPDHQPDPAPSTIHPCGANIQPASLGYLALGAAGRRATATGGVSTI